MNHIDKLMMILTKEFLFMQACGVDTMWLSVDTWVYCGQAAARWCYWGDAAHIRVDCGFICIFQNQTSVKPTS